MARVVARLALVQPRHYGGNDYEPESHPFVSRRLARIAYFADLILIVVVAYLLWRFL